MGYVAHLDADCFYVSAERVRHPDLVGRPVGVLGNQGACVIAKSYEMKATGVKTGTPVWEAKKLCPEGIYIKRDFEWYEVLSRTMLDAVREHSTRVEYYSIDEFFFDCETLRVGQPLLKTAQTIRDHIRSSAGLPVTIGVGRTRTLAKLFSDTAKPFGAVAVLTRAHERELLGKLKVTEISGVGGRRAARLEPYGIRTCLDLADANGKLVNKLLTKTGYEIWQELNGFPVHAVRPSRPAHQTIARGGSLAGKVDKPGPLWGWAVRNLERLVEELEYHQVRTGELQVQLHHPEYGGTIGSVSLDSPTDRFEELLDALRMCVRRAYVPDAVVTHMHVIAPTLVRARGVQMNLFHSPSQQWGRVADVKKRVNERVGRFALRSGATLLANEFYQDPSNRKDICDVRGKVCF